MRRLLFPALLACALLRFTEAEPPDPRRRADLLDSIKRVDQATLREHLFFLANDGMEGRETGSAGAHKAAMYVIEHYERCGMKPKGTDGFFQPFGDAPKRGELKDGNTIRFGKAPKLTTLDYEAQFRPAKFAAPRGALGEIVFAGFGIEAPEFAYNDYAGLKVEGKIVLAFDHEPQEASDKSAFDGAKPTKYSDIRVKAETAKARGAVALLVMRDAANHPDQKGIPDDDELGWPPPADAADVGLPVAYLSDEAAASLAAATGRKDFGGFLKKIDETGKPSSLDLKLPASLRLSATPPLLGGQKNVIAMKEGSDPELKNEYVILSAHYDHVGRGNKQNSLGGLGKIHNGADDNASGTSGLMELAWALQPLVHKRSILLINFDGEEAGLLGSKHFAGSPTVPIDKIVAILNMDMISRNKPAAINVGGIGRNARIDQVLKTVSARYGLAMDTDGMEQYLQRSDQWPLMEKGVPGVFFFGGMHGDYHTDGDDPEKSNVIKMKLITLVCLVFLDEVANGENPRK